ncbi:cAMP-binding domain of CRP or a regulatory subunit of cAMP-dependent protein kinases [Modicisalibacter ilicicola DSM 19980]|uniref:cAMP-binding domain of CRP or a regulatory subunit of cAMP-dependent protein kinases n=1 Tax=Modicisalibacter ilicicola DSM 19980 TaxID=1121942 RepID=A0A1M4WDX9_9GAMM|nr:Crp/Fnr family transcriptional regulator [Halomonas ilicicola]SHE79273.1 cAMP-binding domain of CRP or a regulatory subunit of cAMP-dependent protein kinases [Halomonas ilicicola DSM 19980]
MSSGTSHTSQDEVSTKPQHLRELVIKVPWLRHLEAKQLDDLMASSCVRVVEHHEWLFHQGEAARWLYVVLGGGVRLVRTAEDGRLATIRCAERGDTVGELSMLSDKPRYLYSAEALARTHVLVLDLALCWQYVDASPDCRAKFMLQLSEELTDRLEDMVLLTQGDAMSRLIGFILRQLPVPPRLPGVVHLDTPKYLLAAQLAMTPETLSRLLTRLRETGAISVERARLIVHDDQQLRELMAKRH